MRLRAAFWILCSLGGLGLTLGACFDGSVTLGAACEVNAHCGTGQSCTNGVCGQCRDGEAQVGEVCFGASTEKRLEGTVASMLVLPLQDGSGLDLLILAINGDCGDFGGEAGLPCWTAEFAVPDGEGDLILGEDIASSEQGRVDQIAAGDFNADGELDLVAAIGRQDELQAVTTGGPDGQQLAVIELLPGSNPDTVYVADLDGDLDDDIVAGSGLPRAGSLTTSNEVGVVLSNGDGTFQTAVAYETTAIPRVAPPADMDGDGDLDIVVVGIDATSQLGSSVQVLVNDGQGGFTSGAVRSLSLAVLPWATATGDVDGDGTPDLLVTLLTDTPGEGGAPGILAVLRGDGEGGFEDPEEYETGDSPLFVALRDINGDDRLDALVANADDDKVSFYLNGQTRGRLFGSQQQLDTSLNPIAIQAAHLDADGVEDLAIATGTGELSFSLSEN